MANMKTKWQSRSQLISINIQFWDFLDMEMFQLVEAIWLWGYEDAFLKYNNLNFNG